MQLAQGLGCVTMVTGGQGSEWLSRTELKSAVADFIEK